MFILLHEEPSERFVLLLFVEETIISDSIGKVYPLIWRFFPILDQDVDVLLVRDLDSHISRREVSAVNEFLNSSKVRINPLYHT